MPVRVALADDSYLAREALEHVLAPLEEVEVVASCEDLHSLLGALEPDPPDVVLTDIRMPPSNTDEGIQLADRLRRTHPEIGVVVLSQYADPAYVLRLFRSGSERRAYLLKERVADREELLGAIDAVRRGRSVIDPKIVEVMVAARARADSSPIKELTPREREVLAELARGRSNAAIAAELVLTKRAVEKHVNSIFIKLGLTYSERHEEISKRVMAALIYLADAGAEDPPEPGEPALH